jgi:hypothetical protein
VTDHLTNPSLGQPTHPHAPSRQNQQTLTLSYIPSTTRTRIYHTHTGELLGSKQVGKQATELRTTGRKGWGASLARPRRVLPVCVWDGREGVHIIEPKKLYRLVDWPLARCRPGKPQASPRGGSLRVGQLGSSPCAPIKISRDEIPGEGPARRRRSSASKGSPPLALSQQNPRRGRVDGTEA